MNTGYDPFSFDVEAELFEKRNSRGESETWIGGICTTDHMDRDGERILQEGLDFKPFLDHGFFNDNHEKATGGAVGTPTKAELRSLPGGHQGWWVEGKLYNNSRAREIKELATELERSGDSKRKLGFSVEGRILHRDIEDPTFVRRAVVREVAVTRCPTNPATSLGVLAKSLAVSTPAGEPGSAQPLQVEALEGASPARPRRKKKKKMKKSEAVEFLCSLNPALTSSGAERIVDYTLRHVATH